MNGRLNQSDWLRLGLRMLGKDGAHALKVGAMAARLNVSRGSFYWHFRDIGDFRSQLLRSWQERSTDQIILELEAQEAPPDRLKHLMRRAFSDANSLDRAVRSWAAEDANVAAMVAEVDGRRIAYIAGLLTAAGREGGPALARATFLYWAYLGRDMVMDRTNASLASSAMDDIAALFER